MTTLRNLDMGLGITVDGAHNLWKVERLAWRTAQAFTAIGAAAGLAFYGLMKPAAEFQQAMKGSLAYTGLFGDELLQAERKAKKLAFALSNELGVSSTQVVKDMRDIFNLGINPLNKSFDDLIITAERMAKLEKGMDFKQLSRMLFKAKEAFPDRSYGEIGDAVFMASRKAPTYMSELAKAAEKAFPVGKAMGQDLQNTLGLLMTFSTMAQSGAQAGTRFRRALRLVRDDSTKEAKVLKSIGLDAKRDFMANGEFLPFGTIVEKLGRRAKKYGKRGFINITEEVFGLRGVEAWLVAMDNGGKKTKEFADILRSAKDDVLKGLNVSMESMIEQAKRAGSSWYNLRVVMGTPLLNVFDNISRRLGQMLRTVTDFIEASPRLRSMITLFVGLGLPIIALAAALGTAGMMYSLFLGALLRFKVFGSTIGAIWWRLAWYPLLMSIVLVALILVIDDLIVALQGGDAYLSGFVKQLINAEGPAKMFIGLMAGAAIAIAATFGVTTGLIVAFMVLGLAVTEFIARWDEIRETWNAIEMAFKQMMHTLENELARFIGKYASGIMMKLLFGDLDVGTTAFLLNLASIVVPGAAMVKGGYGMVGEAYEAWTSAKHGDTSAGIQVQINQNNSVTPKDGEPSGDVAAKLARDGVTDLMTDKEFWASMGEALMSEVSSNAVPPKPQ